MADLSEIEICERNVAYLTAELRRWRQRLYEAKRRAGLKGVARPRGLTAQDLAAVRRGQPLAGGVRP